MIARIFTGIVLLFLIAPIVVIFPLSFSSGELLTLPTPGWSWRWYRDFFGNAQWLLATRNSFVVGIATMILATLTTFDRNLLKAAATCGAPPHVAFTRVVLPLIAPGVATGALFAFATSFDELVVAIFVSSPEQFTLPRQMFAGLREFLSPTIAAAAVLLIACSVLLLAANEMLRARAKGRTIAADPAEPN